MLMPSFIPNNSNAPYNGHASGLPIHDRTRKIDNMAAYSYSCLLEIQSVIRKRNRRSWRRYTIVKVALPEGITAVNSGMTTTAPPDQRNNETNIFWCSCFIATPWGVLLLLNILKYRCRRSSREESHLQMLQLSRTTHENYQQNPLIKITEKSSTLFLVKLWSVVPVFFGS